MSLSEKLWDTLTTVIKMNDKVERMADSVKQQQVRIEDLTMRVVRLETALEIAMLRPAPKPIPKTGPKPRRAGLPKKNNPGGNAGVTTPPPHDPPAASVRRASG